MWRPIFLSTVIYLPQKQVNKVDRKALGDDYMRKPIELNNRMITKEKIISRYYKSLKNIKELLEICDIMHVYDNTIEPVRIIRKHKEDFSIFPNDIWSMDDIVKLLGD